MEKAIVDGQLVEQSAWSLRLTGPGAAYGAGAFETIRFRRRQPRCFPEHLARLRRACQALGIAMEGGDEEWLQQAKTLFSATGVDEGVFKILVTLDAERTRTALFLRNDRLPEPSIEGCRALVSDVVKSSQALTSRYKTLNYLENWLQLEEARRRGYDESLFRNERGALTEGCGSNLFFAANGALKTPSLDCGLLDGVTRGEVVELAEAMGLRVEEGRFALEELAEASEAFLTNSGVGIQWIREIEWAGGRRGFARPGLSRQLMDAWMRREPEETVAEDRGA